MMFVLLLLLMMITTTNLTDVKVSTNETFDNKFQQISAQLSKEVDTSFQHINFDDELSADEWCFSFASRTTKNETKKVEVISKKDVGSNTTAARRHVCTGGPCDCWLSNCFAYCQWNWCYPQQSYDSRRTYLSCDRSLRKKDCALFDWPCRWLC